MTPWTLALLGLASYRTTILIVTDHQPFGPIRDWVWARFPWGNDPTETRPAGRGTAEHVWFGRAWASRHKTGLARLARLWKNSWGDRLETNLADPSEPGETKLGWLLTCTSCTGVWVTVAWWLAWHLAPAGTITVAAVVAIAGVQRALCEWAP